MPSVAQHRARSTSPPNPNPAIDADARRTRATRPATAGTPVEPAARRDGSRTATRSRYGASGLPPGLSIDPDDRPDQRHADARPATSTSSSTASDGVNSASADFHLDDRPVRRRCVLKPPPPPTPLLSGAHGRRYTASVPTASTCSYSWDFDDGTPETAWSTIDERHAHVHAAGRLLRDGDGERRSRRRHASQTFVQTVHLPLTANRPTASSNVASRAARGGNARLWVVNQDNDSRQRVRRGHARQVPRSPSAPRRARVAVAPNGRIWVTNKQRATISVIDPTSLRGRADDRAAARLAALRHRVRADWQRSVTSRSKAPACCSSSTPATARSSAALTVGPNPRHLSVSGDGASVYVSRFITPPLPGESTATVQTRRRRRRRGRASSTRPRWPSCARSCCAHSDKPDFENQGRGMPNYLGAAAISPDGTHGLGAVEAGQHQARHAARRRRPQLPEHRARDQLAHRSRRAARRTTRRASTTTTRASPARRRSTARRLPVRRARDQPRGRGGRRHGALRDVPLRRRPRAAGPRGVARRPDAVRQQLHGPHGRRLRPDAAARTTARPTCRCSRR